MPASERLALRPSNARERRVVMGGAVVVAVALALTYVLVPFVRHWREREDRLQATRARVAMLQTLVADRPLLDSLASAHESALAADGRRVIRARSLTLAASALQSLLQDASDASQLMVTRLDVAPTDDVPLPDAPDPAVSRTRGSPSVPATLAAYCDIHGLASLLRQLANGPRVVDVTRMTVQINPALRGAPDMLQVTLSLRAPVVLE